MRRQQKPDGETPVRDGRSARLDPFSLPARFQICDRNRQAATQSVYIDKQQVIVKRRIADDIPLTVIIPTRQFDGIAAEIGEPGAEQEMAARLVLRHRDPQLCLPLLVDEGMEDIVADWRAWSCYLGLPMVIVNTDGTVRPVNRLLGRLQICDAMPRRMPASVTSRRPRFLVRRKVGRSSMIAATAGREIIARS